MENNSVAFLPRINFVVYKISVLSAKHLHNLLLFYYHLFYCLHLTTLIYHDGCCKLCTLFSEIFTSSTNI